MSNAIDPRLPQQPLPLAQRFPGRSTEWRLRTRAVPLGPRPLVMGIVNVTPDSFSDGGLYDDPRQAIEHGLRLCAAGADLLDIGGESTRPYAERVPADDELRRVMPVLEGLRAAGVPLSIDTSKAVVAEAALAAGVEIINDVTALTGDPRMIDVARTSGAAVCAMHMRGNPQTMQDAPSYGDLFGEIGGFLRDRRDALTAQGIAQERIALDPGIGFGKTHQHNLDLLTGCWRFHDLSCPLLVGPSRKGFIAKVLGDKALDRMAGTIGVTLALAAQGVQILRVHDVGPVRQALELFAAVGGIDGTARRVE